MKFTLVSTVFNEAKRLQQTIQDLENQTCHPTEIIITDAGSIDGTYGMLMDWKKKSRIPITIFQEAKCNVARGRDIAVNAASYNIIISTDFGCRFHPNWLQSMVEPFNDSKVLVVGGAYTVYEDEQVTLPAKAAYLVANGYKCKVHSPSFIPSSRSIGYRKEVFDAIGGYCEWLTLAADDLVFGFEILSKGYKIFKVDQPYVSWGRHEKKSGFLKESYRYGLGDGEANLNFKKFIYSVLQLAVYACNMAFIIAVLFFSAPVKILYYVVGIDLTFFTLVSRFYIAYTLRWVTSKSSQKYNFRVFLYGFYLKEYMNIEYIKGYIKGWLFSSPYQKEEAKLLKKRLSV